MLISESWLREWIDPDLSSEELVAQITMAGLEVDSVEAAAPEFTGVVVGEVLGTEQHPDADKLTVCSVSDGKDSFQVVCGAANVCAGLKVPFARVGAKLSADFTISKAKLRGVESSGMLCSGDELGLEEKSEGLLELPLDAPVGEDIRSYLQLDDTLIEVDLTPNRGDCLSIRGLAREVGVLNRQTVKAHLVKAVKATIQDSISISLDSPEDCPRYLGRIIRDINPGVESPLWLREKLRRSGLRSIDAVVDVTNYVLIELGHPMHAFDLDRIEGDIIVRRAKAGEKLTTLDEKEVELRDDTLLIADEKKALAMAGVMGGLDSSVTGQTSSILLESAFFSPLAIAGKARSYGLQTDAAHRYERGVDYQLAETAMERATELLLDIVGGKAGPVAEGVDQLPAEREIILRQERISKLLGVSIKPKEVEDILTRLGLSLKNKDRKQSAWIVPSWRFDLNIEVDLIEELARVYGYDNIPVSRPASNAGLKPKQESRISLAAYRRALVTLGYQEVISYSFVDADLDESLSEKAAALTLLNPISSEMSVMRTSLWSGLIRTLKHNQNRQQQRARLFETGLTFISEDDALTQTPRLAGLIWGSAQPEQWGEKSRAADFHDARGDLETLLDLTMRAGDFSFEAAVHPALQAGQTARIDDRGSPAGWIGALNPLIQKALDIPGKVYLFEMDLEALKSARLPEAVPVSRFPSVRRDIAVIVEDSVETGRILEVLAQNGGENLKDIVVFDLYSGENISKGKKSLALGLTFKHASRTLTDDEINSIISSAIKELQDKFNVELRM